MPRHSRKADGRPSLQFYPSDWLEDTGLRLSSLEAKGLWMDVLCHAFNAEERGAFRSKANQRLSKSLAKLVSEDVSKVEAALKELIENEVCESDGESYIYSRRMVRDEKQRRSKVEAGSKGGRVSRPPSRIKANRRSTTPSSSPTPITTTKNKNIYTSEFEQFWSVYPRKIAKPSAYRAWLKLNPDENTQAAITAKVKEAIETGNWNPETDMRYIPHPASWLNAGGYESEYLPVKGSKAYEEKKKQENREVSSRIYKEVIANKDSENANVRA